MSVAAGSAEKHEKHNGRTAALERPIANLSAGLADFDKELRQLVRERPLFAIGAAVAVGYVVGRILSKL